MFENDLKKITISSLISIGTLFGLSLVLILILSLVLSFTPDPSPLIVPLSLCTLYLSCAVGGFIGQRLSEKLLVPVISGLSSLLLVLLISSFFKGESTLSPVGAVFSYIGIFASFILGGFVQYLISNKRPNRRKRRRR